MLLFRLKTNLDYKKIRRRYIFESKLAFTEKNAH